MTGVDLLEAVETVDIHFWPSYTSSHFSHSAKIFIPKLLRTHTAIKSITII